MRKMELQGVNLDVMTNQPVIILRDGEDKKLLPIWIGQFEAQAILMEIQGIQPPRPLTHDLLRNVIERLKGSVEKVRINELRGGTFFATIDVKVNAETLAIDSRPSDAIALAVRLKVPIFAEEAVLEQAGIPAGLTEEEEVNRFREFLNDVGPEDFGNQ